MGICLIAVKNQRWNAVVRKENTVACYWILKIALIMLFLIGILRKEKKSQRT